jgi:ATP-dependent DNA helicase PIF1
MLSRAGLEALNLLSQKAREDYIRPFGGLQLVLSGDFFQLPPVADDSGYCFESSIWETSFPVQIELKNSFRQRDASLQCLLTAIRSGGKLSPTCREIIKKCSAPLNCIPPLKPVVLVATRPEARRINERELNKLKTEFAAFPSHDWGLDESWFKKLDEDSPLHDRVPLRIGSPVLLVRNVHGIKLYNGSRGTVIKMVDPNSIDRSHNSVIEFDRNYTNSFPKIPLVRFGDQDHDVYVGPIEHTLRDDQDKLLARRIQLPIIPCWAITIHKSQGSSLDYLIVDPSKSFGPGMVYVAISRARSLSGLQIISLDEAKIQSSPKVVDFYKRFSKSY